MNVPSLRLLAAGPVLLLFALGAAAKTIDSASIRPAADEPAQAIPERTAAAPADERTADEQPARSSPQQVWDELVERVPDITTYSWLASTRAREDVPRASEVDGVAMTCIILKPKISNLKKEVCFPPLDQWDATELSRVKAIMWAAGHLRCEDRAMLARRCLPQFGGAGGIAGISD
jgi:hypothetical protein